MKTPVVLTVFNKPEQVAKVFEVIRSVKPDKLFIISDAPRKDRPEEAEKCAIAREIVDRVDWDCRVFKKYSEVNMGAGLCLSQGISWVFEQVDEAIFLEHDCLPDPSFFKFCEELLEKYREDERIMMICGMNLLDRWKSDVQSYHFSYYTTAWGWASWKRAWRYYDYNMKLWENPKVKKIVKNVIGFDRLYFKRAKYFDAVCAGKIDTWDFQWSFARFVQSGLSIIPAVNLVVNIGFTEEAENTKDSQSIEARLPLHSISFPLEEPLVTARDLEYAHLAYKKRLPSLTKRIQWKMSKINKFFNIQKN